MSPLLHGVFFSCSEQGLLSSCGGKLLTEMTATVGEHRLQGLRASVVWCESSGAMAPKHRLNSCGAQAYLLHSMWGLPGPGIEPVSPASAAGFFTTEPLEKP